MASHEDTTLKVLAQVTEQQGLLANGTKEMVRLQAKLESTKTELDFTKGNLELVVKEARQQFDLMRAANPETPSEKAQETLTQ